MTPEIKKILYSTDLSENARYAFGYAASLANRYGAGIILLHVIEDRSSYSDNMILNILGEEKWRQLRKSNEQEVFDTIKKRLENFCEEVSKQLPTCPFIVDGILVKTGNPVEEILNQVSKTESDLVVMGAHGRGMLADKLIGSTSRRVLRRCEKPVLLVRIPEGDDG